MPARSGVGPLSGAGQFPRRLPARRCCGLESPRSGEGIDGIRPGARLGGFSLLELTGVLAIVAILAAAVFPVAIRRIDQAAKIKEMNDLGAISNALVLQILSTKIIPSETTWDQAVAAWTSQPRDRVTTTPRGYSRVFLIDTNGWLGSVGLPYTQTIAGTPNAPLHARVMILSTMAQALPVASGKPGAAAFNAIWDTPDGFKPLTWTSWPGQGEDLLIQRLNLDQLFFRLTLVNRDNSGPSPTFSIDSTNAVPVSVAKVNVWNAWYLNSSVVGLCNSARIPMRRFPLTSDYSFVFEGGAWYDQIYGGDSKEVMAQDFAALAAKFLAAQWYPGAHQGGDQQGALVAMFNFMLVYGLWANQFPHFTWHNAASAAQVPEYELLFDVAGNNKRLDEFTGANGLLK